MKIRRGLTGLETAIILVAFVITSTAFAYVVLNMGFMTAEKAQTVIGGSMEEATSSLLMDSDIIGTFANTTSQQSDICLTKAVFYIKLSQGHTAIDMSNSKIAITYANPRCHGVVYDGTTNVTTVSVINGDSDTLLEVGEKYKISIDFTTLTTSDVDPAQGSMTNIYAHPYEEITIEIQPSQGAKMTVKRRIPQVQSEVMGF